MDNKEQVLKEVISRQYFAVLNSVGKSLVPYSNLVSFAITEDWKSLVFFTSRDTRKYRNIKENENVTLLIDNRTNQPSDITNAFAITLIGTADEEPDSGGILRPIFIKRHPHLEGFVNNPGSALISVKAREYIIAGFDKTERIPISNLRS